MPKLTLFGSVLLASVVASNVGLKANAQTQPSISDKGSILGFDYQIWNKAFFPNSTRFFNRITGGHRTFLADHDTFFGSFRYLPENPVMLKYSNPTGFRGLYSYKGKAGKITADVSMDVVFTKHDSAILQGSIGKDKNIVIDGYNFGDIQFNSGFLIGNRHNYVSTSFHGKFNRALDIHYSTDDSATTPPNYIGGELEIQGFTPQTVL